MKKCMLGEFAVLVETPYFSLGLLLSYWSCAQPCNLEFEIARHLTWLSCFSNPCLLSCGLVTVVITTFCCHFKGAPINSINIKYFKINSRIHEPLPGGMKVNIVKLTEGSGFRGFKPHKSERWQQMMLSFAKVAHSSKDTMWHRLIIDLLMCCTLI